MRVGAVILIFVGCCMLFASAFNGTSCAQVRRTFVLKEIGSTHLVPETWTNGEDLQICPSLQTCCSKEMEKQYLVAVQKDFKILLKRAGSDLISLLSTNAIKFRDAFLEMIQLAANSTKALFSDIYPTLEGRIRPHLNHLYADLLAYMSGQEVDLDERVSFFFDSLFPIAYRDSFNREEKDFTDNYKECLRENLAEIRPFSDLPLQTSFEISRSFETARTFLEALYLGVEVLNMTQHVNFNEDCLNAFVRLTYCSHCLNLVQVRPCSGMCLNVVRGCLASVSEMDTAWSEYVSALERMTSVTVGSYNIELVLSNMDNKIADNVMYLMENTARITKKVKEKCGPARRVAQERTPSDSLHPEGSSGRKTSGADDASLYRLLQSFIHKVVELKDFYSSLADRLCNGLKGEIRCWNGNTLGRYAKPVTGIGLSAQKHNPEIKIAVDQDEFIKNLADKLQLVKQELSNQVTSVPLSDSSVTREDSGSGVAFSDDEDYGLASGSGDFHKELGLHFDVKVKMNATDSCPHLSSNFCLLLFLLINAKLSFEQ